MDIHANLCVTDQAPRPGYRVWSPTTVPKRQVLDDIAEAIRRSEARTHKLRRAYEAIFLWEPQDPERPGLCVRNSDGPNT